MKSLDRKPEMKFCWRPRYLGRGAFGLDAVLGEQPVSFSRQTSQRWDGDGLAQICCGIAGFWNCVETVEGAKSVPWTFMLDSGQSKDEDWMKKEKSSAKSPDHSRWVRRPDSLTLFTSSLQRHLPSTRQEASDSKVPDTDLAKSVTRAEGGVYVIYDPTI
ncbi:hypothetical protein B0H13DRAFT_1929082 [Mycena leptocephala]|nr:hypothetical protein B0H13DRAFT_1929082 [Mycena leptocephala]